jgi:hypothetical protein
VAPRKGSAETARRSARSSYTNEIQNTGEEKGVEEDDRYDMWSTVVAERDDSCQQSLFGNDVEVNYDRELKVEGADFRDSKFGV